MVAYTRSWEPPVYVGRALRENSRGGFAARPPIGFELHRRIGVHASSIEQTSNLSASDFKARYLVLNDAYIAITESVLITTFRPMWNGMGLGSNATGKPRMAGKASLWDSLHPGRKGRPEGTSERALEAAELIRTATNLLDDPERDERTTRMIEKIRRRSAGGAPTPTTP